MSFITACYDLQYSPPTYDFVSFLLTAEQYRRQMGVEHLKVVVLPGPKDGFRDDELPPWSVEARQAMLKNIVLPMPKLLPSCGQPAKVAKNRETYRGLFGYGQPAYGTLHMVQAAMEDCYPFQAEPIGRRNYVTITLRECQYWPTRNSNLTEWRKTAEAMRERGYDVIVIRDTHNADEPFFDFEIDPRASRNIIRRAELYAGAEMNFAIANGPAVLCLFMGAPLLMVKLTSPNAPCTNEKYWSECGFKPGAKWPNAKRRQALEWIDETSEGVVAAADRMMTRPSDLTVLLNQLEELECQTLKP